MREGQAQSKGRHTSPAGTKLSQIRTTEYTVYSYDAYYDDSLDVKTYKTWKEASRDALNRLKRGEMVCVRRLLANGQLA